MDQGMKNPPVVNSFRCNEQISTSIVELNKKRKLQYELGNSGLPWPKHKFRNRCSSSNSESLISEISENEVEEIPGRDTDDTLEEADESSKEDCNETIRLHGNTMTSGVQSRYESLSPQTFHQDQSSASSTSSNNNGEHADLEDVMIYSNDRLAADGDIEFAATDSTTEDVMIYSNDRFGAHNDIEFAVADSATEDIMLYSNDVAPNSFLHSSGRWNQGQDARLGSRKPTIDQEFEQYFSMLML